MHRHRLWWAAALVLASNLAAWGFAALNRSGEPEAILELTERELRLPAKQADNTALALELVLERPRDPRDPRRPEPPREAGWFDRAKLESIGFDCTMPVTKENERYYRERPPRSTYAVLEYDGDGWRRQVEASAAEPPEPAAAPAGTGGAPQPGTSRRTALDPLRDSHLAVIDVGNEPSALRARYPDRRRIAIVEATAVLQFVSNAGQPPFLTGRVTSVLPGEINVPREWQRLLESLQTEGAPTTWPPPSQEPRYRVTVKWGRHLEPWIADVQPLPGAASR